MRGKNERSREELTLDQERPENSELWFRDLLMLTHNLQYHDEYSPTLIAKRKVHHTFTIISVSQV